MENNNLDTHLNGSSPDKDSLFDTDDEEEEKEYQDFKQFLDEILGSTNSHGGRFCEAEPRQ